MRLESNGWIEVLSDSPTPSLLAAAKAVLTGASFPERLTRSKDLGETMVVIHAVEIGRVSTPLAGEALVRDRELSVQGSRVSDV